MKNSMKRGIFGLLLGLSVGCLALTGCTQAGEQKKGTATNTPLGPEMDTSHSSTTQTAPIQAPADSLSSQGQSLPEVQATPDNRTNQ